MINGFEQISIDVPDLKKAILGYRLLLGEFELNGSTASRDLNNIRLLLRESTSSQAAEITALSLRDEDSEAGAIDSGSLGISIERVRHRPLFPDSDGSGINAVDHLVLMTNDADACVDLFGKRLGIRMALDQWVPEWGGRMLFFRAGKMTLEVIHNLEKPQEQSRFWGITYQCADIEATIAKLDEAGVGHSEVREGRKPGTRVVTIKSHDLGLPTLLIEPAR